MNDDLTFCLTRPTEVPAPDGLQAWCEQWRRLAAERHDAVGLALRGGFAVDGGPLSEAHQRPAA